MNTTIFVNHSGLTCSDSPPGSFIGLASNAFQLFVTLPIQIWVFWLGTRDIRKGGRLASSDIFTLNLCLLELWIIFILVLTVVTYFINSQKMMRFILFFSGSYMASRPSMNSLLCIERYMAVAHPVMYRNPVFVKYRYIGSGLVWMLTFCFGGFVMSSFPDQPFAAYAVSLSVNLSVITACSLGVLKILLRPSPGETQKEGRHNQKKRAFVIITGVLVGMSVAYGIDFLSFSTNKYITYDDFCLLLGINMWLIQLTSLMQPFLYLSKLGKFSCIKKVSSN